jgi:hypothetical protein
MRQELAVVLQVKASGNTTEVRQTMLLLVKECKFLASSAEMKD